MSLLYFRTDKVSCREQRFSLEVIFVKFVDWSKAQIINISMERPKMKKVRPLYFLKLPESKVLSFFFIFDLSAEILKICAFDQSMNLTEISSKENLCSLKQALLVLK